MIEVNSFSPVLLPSSVGNAKTETFDANSPIQLSSEAKNGFTYSLHGQQLQAQPEGWQEEQ